MGIHGESTVQEAIALTLRAPRYERRLGYGQREVNSTLDLALRIGEVMLCSCPGTADATATVPLLPGLVSALLSAVRTQADSRYRG